LLVLSLTVACLAAGWADPLGVWAKPGATAAPKGAKSQAGPRVAADYVHGLATLPGDAPVPRRDRPSGSAAVDGGPSPVIFPAQKLTIRFNHKKHMGQLGMTCTTCHDAAKKSVKSSDSLLPAAVRCDGCHSTDHRDLSAVRGDP